MLPTVWAIWLSEHVSLHFAGPGSVGPSDPKANVTCED